MDVVVVEMRHDATRLWLSGWYDRQPEIADHSQMRIIICLFN